MIENKVNKLKAESQVLTKPTKFSGKNEDRTLIKESFMSNLYWEINDLTR